MDALLRREGDVWAIQLDGRAARIRDSRGMQHLAVLLTRPGKEVHVLELAGAPEAVSSGDAGPLLDDTARAAYKQRLSDLASDLDEADRFNDPERSARIQLEIDALVDQLTSATGLGGKDRGAVTDAERARVAVRRAMKSALDRIADAHPTLGAHLAATVRTGVFCSYVPDPVSPVRWLIGDAPEPAALPRPDRPLVVGREHEQAALRAAWRAGGVVLLSGEPGIGKTTLLRDLEADVEVSLHGRCDEHLGVPYKPIAEAIRSLIAIDGATTIANDAGVGASALARIVPELGATSDSADAPETERLLLFDAVAQVLRRAADRRPIVVSIDDLHWAPQPTLTLLVHVLRDLDGALALAVLTYRDTEAGDDLRSFLASIARLPHVTRIAPSGLGVDAIIELGASSDDAKRIAQHTNGNPFFVRALLDAPLDDALPASVLDVVTGRVQQLSGEARELVTRVAVAGDRLRPAVVIALAATVDAIDEVLNAGLLVEDEGSIGFPHALVRRAILERTSRVRRTTMHAEVAQALEGAGGSSAELAFHFAEAGAGAEAVRYAIAAAEESLRAVAFEEAVTHAERGLRFAVDGSTEAGRLLVHLGTARRDAGEIAAAGVVFTEAAAIARELDDPELLADVAIERGHGGGQFAVHDRALAAELTAALERLGDRDSHRRAQLLARLAVEESGAGRLVEARALADEAVSLARESADPRVLLAAIRSQYVVLDGPDHLELRKDLALEIDALASAHGGLELQILAKGIAATIAAETCDIAQVDDALAALHVLVQAAGLPRQQWYELQLRVLRTVIEGDLDAAEQTAEREVAAGTAASVPNTLRAYALQLMIIRDEQGRAGELADLAIGMADSEPGTGYPIMASVACERAGRLDDARALLARAPLHDLPRDGVFLGSLCGASTVAHALGDRVAAATIDEQLRPFAGRNCVLALGTVSMGPIDRYLSITARTLGETERATLHLADAVALDERMHARRWLERDRADLACLLVSTGT